MNFGYTLKVFIYLGVTDAKLLCVLALFGIVGELGKGNSTLIED